MEPVLRRKSQFVYLVVITLLIFGSAVPAGGPARAEEVQDEFDCQATGSLALAPGIQALPTRGSLSTAEPMDLTCTGTLDGHSFESVQGHMSLDGTYGDGPVSDLSGGATCSHNDGYLDVLVELPLFGGTVTLTEDDYYWQRWAALLIRSDDSFAGAESSQLLGTVTERYGRCTSEEPITRVKVEMRMTFAGELRYSFESSNSAPSASISSPTSITAAPQADIVALVHDSDGTSDLLAATLTIASSNGQFAESWEIDKFASQDGETLILTLDDHLLIGSAPWAISLSAVDTADQSSFDSTSILRSP